MTIWQPTLDADRPHYQAIADAVERDLETGRLEPGTRLPTHRELAKTLGVTVGTVSRGYAEAERRGLTVGEVGRGTYVQGPRRGEDPFGAAPGAPDHWRRLDASHGEKEAPRSDPAGASESDPPTDPSIDLTLSLPVTLPEEAELFAATLREIAGDRRVGELLHYRPESATPRQRALGARWLATLGLDVRAPDVLVTAGSQHGLNVALSSLFSPGSVLLTEALTYPSIKSQARALGLRLRGIELDEEGAIPESIDEACRSGPKPTGLYLVPTLQNPTVAQMGALRRRQIVAVARRHDLWILEDDVHAFLPQEPATPLAALAPERTIYLASVAKCLAPGLRTGYVVAPPPLRRRFLDGVHTTLWMPPPLTVEVTSRWLESGLADTLIRRKRRATAERRALAVLKLANLPAGTILRSDPASYHLWLELPEPWCADEVVNQARERGVHLLGAGVFAVGRRGVPHALRLSVGVPKIGRLETALEILADLLRGGGAPGY